MKAKSMNDLLRTLPAVDALLNSDGGVQLVAQFGHDLARDALRAALDDIRARIRAGDVVAVDDETVLSRAHEQLQGDLQPTLRPVINATGVIIHTNLGRAPLSDDALEAMRAVGGQYNTLEFDLTSGKRGSRLLHASAALQAITGAEAALVVNNNASALVLLLSALAQGRECVISRGQLVEIGGGFRVPDVMAQSGVQLVEVGATNRTRAADYEQAVGEATALLMRAHASNFKVVGFTEQASLADMADIAHRHGIHLVDDLGSGALLDTATFGLDHEPTVQESLAAGADLVAFSGDKLLGGPQAGILVGKRALIDQLKRHPLARAVRADKLALAALMATLNHYRKGEALEKIPVWQMIARPLDDIRHTAESWAQQVGGTTVAGESTVGGGSLPGATLPTVLLALDVAHADDFAAKLRGCEAAIITRIADGRVLLDPRTVLPRQEPILLQHLHDVLQNHLDC